jgi:hypothetical protein
VFDFEMTEMASYCFLLRCYRPVITVQRKSGSLDQSNSGAWLSWLEEGQRDKNTVGPGDKTEDHRPELLGCCHFEIDALGESEGARKASRINEYQC